MKSNYITVTVTGKEGRLQNNRKSNWRKEKAIENRVSKLKRW